MARHRQDAMNKEWIKGKRGLLVECRYDLSFYRLIRDKAALTRWEDV